MTFSTFLYMGLSRSHVLGCELVKLTRVDSVFFLISIDIFFSFVFHHLVYLRVDLHCFNQFFMYEVILILQPGYEYDMLTRLFFFKIDIFLFVLQYLICW